MKVVLISNPTSRRMKPDFPPIGIAYLGAVAYDRGYEVLLIDGGLTGLKDIGRQVKKFAPDFVGVTCWTINRGIVWELCAILQKIVPAAFLAVGGPHASFYPEHIFVKTHATAVVIGEGEETMCELLDTIKNGGDLAQVRGIAYRKKDGTVERTEPRPQVKQLDSIPFPYYAGFRDFSFQRYAGLAGLTRPTAAVITSRGCVFDCTYCGSVNFWGKKWRYRSAENVLDELQHLVKGMGARSIYIFDDNFPVNKQRTMNICRGIIDRKLNIQWACCSHVKMMNEELLDVMKESGCVSIDFGVESGSDIILKNINKKQNRGDIERTFTLVHKAGIKPRAYLMVGNKGETIDTIDATIEMAKIIKPHSSIGATILWLLPGTRVFSEARENGFIDDDYWLRSDDVPYNLQEYSYRELFGLRQRLMRGIAKGKGGIAPMVNFYLKSIYYRYPFLSRMRSLISDRLR
ncbi:MAG: radical SAM protein [Planctomycetes bacterium]|nr:radical SAM protein [Planctomycetota bacterium]